MYFTGQAHINKLDYYDVFVFRCVQMSRVTVALSQHKGKASKVTKGKPVETIEAGLQANKTRKKAWKKVKKERRRAGESQHLYVCGTHTFLVMEVICISVADLPTITFRLKLTTIRQK